MVSTCAVKRSSETLLCCGSSSCGSRIRDVEKFLGGRALSVRSTVCVVLMLGEETTMTTGLRREQLHGDSTQIHSHADALFFYP